MKEQEQFDVEIAQARQSAQHLPCPPGYRFTDSALRHMLALDRCANRFVRRALHRAWMKSGAQTFEKIPSITGARHLHAVPAAAVALTQPGPTAELK
jgi:hypothetical protein